MSEDRRVSRASAGTYLVVVVILLAVALGATVTYLVRTA